MELQHFLNKTICVYEDQHFWKFSKFNEGPCRYQTSSVNPNLANARVWTNIRGLRAWVNPTLCLGSTTLSWIELICYCLFMTYFDGRRCRGDETLRGLYVANCFPGSFCLFHVIEYPRRLKESFIATLNPRDFFYSWLFRFWKFLFFCQNQYE